MGWLINFHRDKSLDSAVLLKGNSNFMLVGTDFRDKPLNLPTLLRHAKSLVLAISASN
jgi:hypothetical protein